MADATSDTTGTVKHGALADWYGYLLIACMVAVQIGMAFFRQIHMDEYLFLTKVFEYERGSLTQILQTFHVHLFVWLVWLPVDDFTRIIFARGIMVVLHAATLFFIYRIARSFVAVHAAILITLIYATALYVLQYATSFRADGFLAALFTGALFALTRPQLSFGLVTMSAVSIALAGLISIKAVFYVPIIGAVALWRLYRTHNRLLLFWQMASAALLAAFVFTALFALHAASLHTPPAAASSPLAGAVTKQLMEVRHFATVWYLVALMIANPLQSVLVLVGIAATIWGSVARTSVERFRCLILLSFAYPVMLVFFYRNAFPYFYVFMLPSVPLVVAVLFDNSRASIIGRYSLVLSSLLTFQALALAYRDLPKNNDGQRELHAAIHEIFPQPVPYLDGISSVPSFPWTGIFMTSWGMQSYESSNHAIFSDRIASAKPVFVVAESKLLTQALETGTNPENANYLLRPEDLAAFHDNYIHHWGPIWIAGKNLGDASSSSRNFMVRIDGAYTFESDGSGKIDGVLVSPGNVINLTSGVHEYSGPQARLRWGDHLRVPDFDPPETLYVIEPGLDF